MALKRREFLQGFGAAATVGLVGCNGRDGDKAPPGPKGAEAIEHIVFVMMENRSFDHYLGDLANEGRKDVDGLQNAFDNRDYSGTRYPPHLTRHTDLCPGDPPHGWGTSRDQFTAGTNEGFVKAYVDRHGMTAPQVPMGFYDRSGLPVLYAMADAFTVCDQWYCSLMSSTWPNRLYAHGAQNEGMFGNDLPDGKPYTMRTIWDQLDDASVSWAYYMSDAPFTAILGMDFDRDELRVLEDFFADCKNGTLPTISQVEPAFLFNDDHPPHHPLLGQIFLSSIYEALAQSPLWGKTLLIITYDEHGGYYDHVAPPTAPDNHASTGHNQLGFRVPSVVVGPWVKPGYCSNVAYDHTSWLAHVQHKFGLPHLTKRDQAANDLSDCIQDEQFIAPPLMPVIEMSEEEIQAQCHIQTRGAQPELEAYLDYRQLGDRYDRRNQLGKVIGVTLEHAQRLGVLNLT